MKKFYLYFICCLLCSLTASAQISWDIGFPVAANITATLSGGTLTISGTGAMVNYSSASVQPWASQRNAITHLVINEGVTAIGDYAFMNFDQLTDITIPGSVETFGKFAFHKSSIHSITISGNSLKKIGLQAFDDCRNLITVTLPASIETIDDYAFFNGNIHSVIILGNSLKTIGFGAFALSPNLKFINIPASVESIGESAFANCGALTEVINYAETPLDIKSNVFQNVNTGTCILRVPATSVGDYKAADVWKAFKNIEPIITEVKSGVIGAISWILSSNGVLTFSGTGDIPNWVFNDPALNEINSIVQSIVINEGITGIVNYAFGDAQAISMSIAASVTKIGPVAFFNCNNMVSISVHPTNPEYSSANGVLFSKDGTTLISFPRGQLNHYAIPPSVTTIGYAAFHRCRLPSLTIPASVKTIEDDAFTFCNNLTSITIPASVTSIGGNVFYGCNEMTSIVVEAGNPNYSSSADGALFNFDKSALIAFPSGKTGNYNIPEAVKIIGRRAFMYCEKLTSVNIPNTIETIADLAFTSCLALSNISIPASVKSIEGYVFARCYALISISVHENNENYTSENGVLFTKDMTTLLCVPTGWDGRYIIPGRVINIAPYVFYGCEELSSIVFQGNVSFMGNKYFDECGRLTEIVHISPAPQDIASDLFDEKVVASSTLWVPAASVALYKESEGWKKFKNIEGIDVIMLDHSSIGLLVGAEKALSATLDVLLQEIQIEWTSSNPAVASIDPSGKVTAIRAGTAEITASAGSNEAKCTVTVIQPGNSTIEGTVNNAGGSNVRINLYMKPPESETKRGIIGGYVLLATTVPNDNGEYSFEDLPEGSYQVEVVMDDYEPEATEELSLSGEENLTYVNFTVDVETGEINVEIKEEEKEEEEIKTDANEFFASDLKIYPNPFTDVVRIVGVVETWRAASLQIRIINTAGVIVHTQTIASLDETIHLGHLTPGMYIIQIENVGTKKVIKIQ